MGTDIKLTIQMTTIDEVVRRAFPSRKKTASIFLNKNSQTAEMLFARISSLTTLSKEEDEKITKHFISLAQEPGLPIQVCIDNLVCIAMCRGVDFITERKSYYEVITSNLALAIQEPITSIK